MGTHMSMPSKVLIGMSGGVDSSVAALLLKKEGYDVHGFTLRMWSEEGYAPSRAPGGGAGELATGSRLSGISFRLDEGRCCSREAVQAAVAVSRKIGIPHAVVDVRRRFKEEVVGYFISEYRQGRTPNPCARCNERIRFGSFFEQVEAFGADFLATGHYAGIFCDRSVKPPELFFAKAKDKRKSQEYFLALVARENLSRILFPLSDLTKDEVRDIARRENLPVTERESQDVCFIPDGDTSGFLDRHIVQKSGEIVDIEGNVLGRHKGIWFHTIGQRKGLGVAAGEPLFVLRLDAESNRVIVGPRSALRGTSFTLTGINRFTDRDLSGLPLTCKIRYATPEVPCRLEGSSVILEKPLDAVTPGQLGVIYWEDKVVMAGIIDLSRQIHHPG